MLLLVFAYFPYEKQKHMLWTLIYLLWVPTKVDKQYSGCYLKTTKLPDSALIGMFAVIRSNTVDMAAREGHTYV